MVCFALRGFTYAGYCDLVRRFKKALVILKVPSFSAAFTNRTMGANRQIAQDLSEGA